MNMDYDKIRETLKTKLFPSPTALIMWEGTCRAGEGRAVNVLRNFEFLAVLNIL